MLDVTTDRIEPEEEVAAGHQAFVETPRVAFASTFFAPFAAMTEAQMFWRKSAGLMHRWNSDLAKCRSAAELIDINARYGEKAMALGYSEAWRVIERSAWLGRSAVAPESFKLRDAEQD